MGKFGDAAQFALNAAPVATGLIDRALFMRNRVRQGVEDILLNNLNFQLGFDPETEQFNAGNPIGDPLSGFNEQFGVDENGNPFTPQQAQLRFMVEQLQSPENAQTRGINAFGGIGNTFGGASADFATDFQNPQSRAISQEDTILGINQANRPINEPIPDPIRPREFPEIRDQIANSGALENFLNNRLPAQQGQGLSGGAAPVIGPPGSVGPRPQGGPLSGALEQFLRSQLPVTPSGGSFAGGTPFVNPPLGKDSVDVKVHPGEAIIPADQNLAVRPPGSMLAPTGGGLGFAPSQDILSQLQGQAVNPGQIPGLDQLSQQAQNPQTNVGLQGAQDVFGGGFGNVAGQQNLNQLAGGGQGSLVGNVLENPTGFGAGVAGDIFNRGKETLDAETAALQRQLRGGAAQSGALGTGQFNVNSLGLEQSRLGQLSNLQRDIGIQTAQQSFQNQLQSAGLQQSDLGRQFGQQLGASQFDLNRLGQQGQGLLGAGALENQVNQGNFGNLLSSVGAQQGVNQQNFQNLFDTGQLTEGITQGQFGREVGIQDRISALDQSNQQRQSDFFAQLAEAGFTAEQLNQLGINQLFGAAIPGIGTAAGLPA